MSTTENTENGTITASIQHRKNKRRRERQKKFHNSFDPKQEVMDVRRLDRLMRKLARREKRAELNSRIKSAREEITDHKLMKDRLESECFDITEQLKDKSRLPEDLSDLQQKLEDKKKLVQELTGHIYVLEDDIKKAQQELETISPQALEEQHRQRVRAEALRKKLAKHPPKKK